MPLHQHEEHEASHHRKLPSGDIAIIFAYRAVVNRNRIVPSRSSLLTNRTSAPDRLGLKLIVLRALMRSLWLRAFRPAQLVHDSHAETD
jgi:hypothetical protein